MRRRPSQELRDRHGAQIMRVASRLFNSGRMFHADPNPGNYLLLPDGRLGLLDFGCVRECDAAEWELMVLGLAGFRNGGEDLRRVIQRSALLSDEELADEERYELTVRSCEWLWAPMRRDEPFDFGDERYLEEGLSIMVQLIRRRYTKTDPIFTWMNRTLYGVRALAWQLRARINLTRINEEEIQRAGL
jgi:predicted unusual protein kinase regulating ubiquinone biosynthesis (AarF/ABC1/UbiB family)